MVIKGLKEFIFEEYYSYEREIWFICELA
ncbi:hypothetical protein HPK19_14050 [Arthrobacter citreus]|nr:hypothetical protein HPK19_14050 [Arthrobacter citreus]